MRRALTLQERLEEARTELWLCRLACDLTLARWAAGVTGTPPASAEPDGHRPASGPDPSPTWPAWQPIWLHDRCRPVALKA